MRPWPSAAPLAESGSRLQIRTGFSHHDGRCVRPIHSCHPAHKVTDAANNEAVRVRAPARGGDSCPGGRWAWRGRERGAATLLAKS